MKSYVLDLINHGSVEGKQEKDSLKQREQKTLWRKKTKIAV